jgi:tetratricopeptide (TPR) repeat protein
LGQVDWLLRHCHFNVLSDVLILARNSYGKALALDAENLNYNQMYARLSYAVWTLQPMTAERSVWLYDALGPINKAYHGGLANYRTLRFRTNILNGLLPTERQRLQTHLDAGDYDQAAAQLAVMIEQGPEIVYSLVQIVEQERRVVEEQLRQRSDSRLEERGDALRKLLEEAQDRVPELLFAGAVQALDEGRSAEGAARYRQGLALAAEQGRIQVVKEELLRLLAAPPTSTVGATLLAQIPQAMPMLEQATQRTPGFRAAASYALLATALKDFPSAGRWYEEALRRMAEGGACPTDEMNMVLRDLNNLWGEIPPRAFDLWHALEIYSQRQLAEHPELNTELWGYYWRCRAWVKYRIARAAFAQGQPPAAYTILRSSGNDIDQAVRLNAVSGETDLAYISEGAWAFFHVERAERHADRAEYEAAFQDYAEAARLFQPVLDNTAREEKLTATFKAGLMAARLGDASVMLNYYNEGVALAQRYRNQIKVKPHIKAAHDELAALGQAADLNPSLAKLLDALVERLAMEVL